MNKLDKGTFSGYLALSGCMIQPGDIFACVDIDLCESKMYEISDPRLCKKIDIGILKSVCALKHNLYYGNISTIYKLMVLAEYQVD